MKGLYVNDLLLKPAQRTALYDCSLSYTSDPLVFTYEVCHHRIIKMWFLIEAGETNNLEKKKKKDQETKKAESIPKHVSRAALLQSEHSPAE